MDQSALYLDFQVVLAGQAPQHLLYFLEIPQAHTPLDQDSHLGLACLEALVDLGNHGLPLHHRRDTKEWMENMIQKSLLLL